MAFLWLRKLFGEWGKNINTAIPYLGRCCTFSIAFYGSMVCRVLPTHSKLGLLHIILQAEWQSWPSRGLMLQHVRETCLVMANDLADAVIMSCCGCAHPLVILRWDVIRLSRVSYTSRWGAVCLLQVEDIAVHFSVKCALPLSSN